MSALLTVAVDASAQFPERIPPSAGATVPVSIDSLELPRHFGRTSDANYYAPLLDSRRRIIANAYVRTLELRGPGNGRSMSLDTFRENGPATCPYPSPYVCTALATDLRDRLELYWGWDYVTPEDSVFETLFNRVSGTRDTLAVPYVAAGDSMLFPGAHLRFMSGPAVNYVGGAANRWSFMAPAAVPFGEGTGYTIDEAILRPSTKGIRGYSSLLWLGAYERATLLLLGGSAGTTDSVTFMIDPSVARPTIAIWTPTAGSGTVWWRCGAPPSSTVYTSFQSLSSTGLVDLTGGCASAWYVTVTNTATFSRQVEVRIGSLTAGSAGPYYSRKYDLIIGTEVAASAGEMNYVRRVMRAAAWRFYGVTGGSHMILTNTYQNGDCGGAHVCFRNVTNCATEGGAIWHPTTLWPYESVDICRNITGWDGSVTYAGTASVDASTMTHEYGHLLTATPSAYHLGDEYWVSNAGAKICGAEGISIRRCNHSVMGVSAPSFRVFSYCVDRTHMSATEVIAQTHPLGPWTRLGSNTPVGPIGASTWTLSECTDGSLNQAGYSIWSAWEMLATGGAAPSAHPNWSPDNHDFWNFAEGGSIVIGRNVN